MLQRMLLVDIII